MYLCMRGTEFYVPTSPANSISPTPSSTPGTTGTPVVAKPVLVTSRYKNARKRKAWEPYHRALNFDSGSSQNLLGAKFSKP